ncbi:CLUMA_CG006923, isoform A [Clunio marinus]|uniref:CLUMA_CG006923, isoform A n=1 Tax=Clunio marinus TaxID=568069 RepID=A0A1J1HZK2_9DIPT|nr:CLUMA_CG006923, isoform A [Clunio marinus]
MSVLEFQLNSMTSESNMKKGNGHEKIDEIGNHQKAYGAGMETSIASRSQMVFCFKVMTQGEVCEKKSKPDQTGGFRWLIVCRKN